MIPRVYFKFLIHRQNSITNTYSYNPINIILIQRFVSSLIKVEYATAVALKLKSLRVKNVFWHTLHLCNCVWKFLPTPILPRSHLYGIPAYFTFSPQCLKLFEKQLEIHIFQVSPFIEEMKTMMMIMRTMRRRGKSFRKVVCSTRTVCAVLGAQF